MAVPNGVLAGTAPVCFGDEPLAVHHHDRVLGDGSQSKPYVYVEDCLDGMEFGVANAKDHVNYYNLAVDDQTAVREIADWTIESMGIKLPPELFHKDAKV